MKRTGWAAFCIILMLCLNGCSAGHSKEVVLVTDQQGESDHSYNEWAQQALDEIASEYSYKTRTIVPTSSAGYMANLADAAAEDPVYIIVSSPKMENATALQASALPEQYFVLVDALGDLNLDGLQDAPNIFSVMFRNEQIGFLAGYACGMKSQSVPAFIGGNEYVSTIEYEAGFVAGVKAANSALEPAILYIPPEYSQEDAAKQLASLTAKNVDIAFCIADSNAALTVLKGLNIRLITLSTLSEQPKNAVLTVNKDIKAALKIVAKVYKDGLFKGQVRYFSAEENCITFTALDESYFTSQDSAMLNAVRSSLETTQIPKARE